MFTFLARGELSTQVLSNTALRQLTNNAVMDAASDRRANCKVEHRVDETKVTKKRARNLSSKPAPAPGKGRKGLQQTNIVFLFGKSTVNHKKEEQEEQGTDDDGELGDECSDCVDEEDRDDEDNDEIDDDNGC